MNRRFLAVLAATSIAVALLAAVSVAFRVFETVAAGRKAASADFETLLYSFSRAHNASDLGDPALRKRLAAQYRLSPNLLLVVVYERGAGVRWRLPAYSPYLPAAENELPRPQPQYPPFSSILLSAPLPGDPSGLLALDALYLTLDQRTVFLAFRDALIAIAIYIALVAAAIALAAAISSTQSKDSEELDPELSRRMAAAAATEEEERVMGLSDSESPGAKSSDPSGNAAYPFSTLEEEFSIPDIAAPGGAPAGAAARAQPSGLFSPRSSLGWENYLEARLDAELQRSASFEQDLSLLLIRYENLHGEPSPEYKALADTIAEFFSFRDLAFERSDDGFAVILPNIDIDHALRMSEEFVKKLDSRMESFRGEHGTLPVFLGLSSRTGRLVDSSRMMQEAIASLEKARTEGDSRIVAFRPDPEKYRLYLASKGCA
jgi:hypothetical protein